MEMVDDESNAIMVIVSGFLENCSAAGALAQLLSRIVEDPNSSLGVNLDKKKETPVRISEPGNRSRSEFADSVDDIASLRNFYRPKGVLKTDPETHATIGKTDATRIEIGGPVRRPI